MRRKDEAESFGVVDIGTAHSSHMSAVGKNEWSLPDLRSSHEPNVRLNHHSVIEMVGALSALNGDVRSREGNGTANRAAKTSNVLNALSS